MICTSKNVSRYEIRYRHRLSKQFKESEIKAGILFDEKVYIKLVNRYVSDFKLIQKHSEIKLDTENMRTPKNFWDQMALLMIDRIGQNGAVDLVEELTVLSKNLRFLTEKMKIFSKLYFN